MKMMNMYFLVLTSISLIFSSSVLALAADGQKAKSENEISSDSMSDDDMSDSDEEERDSRSFRDIVIQDNVGGLLDDVRELCCRINFEAILPPAEDRDDVSDFLTNALDELAEAILFDGRNLRVEQMIAPHQAMRNAIYMALSKLQ